MLTPDYYYRSVHDIDLGELHERGIDTLLVDLDNTLLPRDSDVIPDAVRDWVGSLASQGMRACMVSNNWHARAVQVADGLGIPVVAKALKPLPFAFRKAMEIAETRPQRCAVVGDQLFTDVLGGKVLGSVTVLVTPVSVSDLPHTLLLRRIERMLLADRQPLP